MATYDPGRHAAGGGWLCLHRNENLFVDQGWAAEVVARLVAAGGVSAYPDPSCAELRAALARLHGVEPANIHAGNGSDGVLADLLALLRPRFQGFHTVEPAYRVYPMLAARLGYRVEPLAPGALRP